ncbi:hypothetical protein QQY66_01420 [Streptomyces sp. DG2A-72]|uniref:hypothetical protein n=1 Tax=Streptomyces sp. DG2A-72 TaxID=3051386 RepID=UPI00265BC814|nr:hypothetical protein [Streptomyces sp. DG2A-72]MDO0930421.1 hypothetical protein [Streptomyces sp. DG2A-72]
MGSDAQWFVLVEGNFGYGSEKQWVLMEKHHVDGDRATALSQAEEICRIWCPGSWTAEDSGRVVFQISESSWLVEVTHEDWSERNHRAYTDERTIRVTVAHLAYAKETPPAHPPEKPEKKAGGLRRAFGG